MIVVVLAVILAAFAPWGVDADGVTVTGWAGHIMLWDQAAPNWILPAAAVGSLLIALCHANFGGGATPEVAMVLSGYGLVHLGLAGWRLQRTGSLSWGIPVMACLFVALLWRVIVFARAVAAREAARAAAREAGAGEPGE
jgi:hypothetical protein